MTTEADDTTAESVDEPTAEEAVAEAADDTEDDSDLEDLEFLIDDIEDQIAPLG